MATGVQLLASLASFFSNYLTQPLGAKRDALKLTLNPSCVKYLNGRLKELKLGIALPSESDRLQFIDQGVRALTYLKLEPTNKNRIHHTAPIDLSYFVSLTTLEIDMCKPATIVNMRQLASRLKKLILRNVLNDFRELTEFEEEAPLLWPVLQELDCGHNQLPEIKALGQMTGLERLDLSDNLLSRVDGLGECPRLDSLDLSHNTISSTVRIYEVLGNIRHLFLRFNKLAYTTGLEKLYALETLDLANNVISSYEEVRRLNTLPCLKTLVLADNPVFLLDDYRQVLAGLFLSTHPQLKLDGRALAGTQAKAMPGSAGPASPAPTPTAATGPAIASAHVVASSVPVTRLRGGLATAPVSVEATSPPKNKSASTDTTPTTTPQKKKTKPRRVVDLAGVPPAGGPRKEPQPAVPEEIIKLDEKSVEFKSKIESLHKEAGPSWLLILNELQMNDSGIDLINAAAKDANAAATATSKLKNKRMSRKVTDEDLAGVPGEFSTSPSNPAPPLISPVTGTPMVVSPVSSSAASASTSPLPNTALSGALPSASAQVGPAAGARPVLTGSGGGGNSVSAAAITSTTTTSTSTSARQAAVDLNTPSITTEEFFALVRTDPLGKAMSWEPRIVIVSADVIRELDVTSGKDVVRYDTRSLVSVSSSSPPDAADASKLIVTLEFVYRDRKSATVQYKLERSAAGQLQAILTRVVATRRFALRTKCMACGSVVDTPKGGLQQCTKCGSGMLVEFDAPLLHDSAAPASAAGVSSSSAAAAAAAATGHLVKSAMSAISTSMQSSAMLSASLATSPPSSGALRVYGGAAHVADPNDVDDVPESQLDPNTALYFRLNFFRKGAEEKFIHLFRCNYLRGGPPGQSEEIVAFLLLTSVNIYIITQKKRPAEPLRGFSLLAEHKLSEIRRVVVGLFYQYFRLEVDENNWHVIVTRAHARTHAFVDLLRAITAPATLEVSQMVRDTVSAVTGLLSRPRVNLQAYVLVYLCRKTSAFRSLMPEALIGPVSPRTLILTEEHIVLCEEDYGRTSNTLATKQLTTQIQFSKAILHPVSDVVAINIQRDAPSFLAIEFEREADAASQVWDLHFQAPEEHAQFLRNISRLWKSIFKIDLVMVEDKGTQPTRRIK